MKMKSRSWYQTTLRAFLVLGLAGALSASAEVRLPHVFSEHMVLQRDVPIPVWGWAEPGETVTVQLGQATAKATADAQGKWRVTLPKQPAGGPLTLVVSGSSKITLEDVLVGEVWLCSGQSNMEMGMKMIRDAANDIASASNPQLRLFLVPKRVGKRPEQDVDAKWEVCSPQSLVRGGWGGFSAAAYYFACELQAKLKVPVGVIESSWGGTRIEPWTPPCGFESVSAVADISTRVQLALPSSAEHKKALGEAIAAMEAWQKTAREALQAEAVVPRLPAVPSEFWPQINEQSPTALYNGMIHALVPFALRGAIWYQGESNHGEGALYTEKMKALIGGWRQLWQQGDFPFLYVQIAPYMYGEENAAILPVFWEAQSAALKIPNTGMAVTTDISDLRDIHPQNKKEVGRRLALLALAGTYGQKDLVANGPVFKEMKIEGAKLRLSFDSIGGGLASRDGKPLSHFEVIDADTGGFVPADAAIEDNSVVLSAPAVPHPVAMRFAWHKLAEPNLMNREGLPAAPFRAGEVPVRDCLNIPEAKGFQLVYDLDLKKAGPRIAYDADNSAKITGAVDRVAYCLELGDGQGDPQFIFIAMDPFTTDLHKIGVPAFGSKASFQQKVRNLLIATNVKAIAPGTRPEGNIEFWPNNYAQANSAHIPGASDTLFDFGDQPTDPEDGYGSMQIHDFAAKQTLLAFNHWSVGESADVGIGNAPRGNPDWTFAGNAAGYSLKRLRVLVRTR
jgi:sialate O-acetylesterase